MRLFWWCTREKELAKKMQRNYPDRNGLTLLTKNKSGINKSGKKKIRRSTDIFLVFIKFTGKAFLILLKAGFEWKM